MATGGRSWLTAAKKAISTVFARSHSSLVPSTSSNFLRHRHLVAFSSCVRRHYPAVPGSAGGLETPQISSSVNDPSPNCSNRPSKQPCIDGCDYEHWFVVMEKPAGSPSRDEIIDVYIKTLAQVVGSEEEARMRIYSVSTRHYYAFGALVSAELSEELEGLEGVRLVLPDSYLDIEKQDYGGEPFINGQAVPYDPKYHEVWVRNQAAMFARRKRKPEPRNMEGVFWGTKALDK